MIWLAVVALCAVSFLFAGIEAGLLSLDPVRLRSHVKQKTLGAGRLERLHEHPGRLLVTVLLITNIADIVALLLATRVLVQSFGWPGYLITAAAAAPIYLFLLGVLPRALFRRLPFGALAALAGVLEIASLILSPLIIIGELVGRLFLPHRKSEKARLFAAREELKQVAVQSEREGALTATERAMIHNVVDFRNLRVRDVMLPLDKCTTLHRESSVADVLQLGRTSGLERFPVISPEGSAIGLINIFDVLLDKSPHDPLAQYMRRIVTAPETEPAYRVIRRLRAARLGLAAVVDAERKLIGIASLEELVKRLVQSA
ncbi:MAG: CNNM domain-containing protein [Chthoniobacterales bacterium]